MIRGTYDADELAQRRERDEEREPRPRFVARARHKQFRYWAGISFRPVRVETERRTS